jgi:hypothetical protein
VRGATAAVLDELRNGTLHLTALVLLAPHLLRFERISGP